MPDERSGRGAAEERPDTAPRQVNRTVQEDRAEERQHSPPKMPERSPEPQQPRDDQTLPKEREAG